MSAAPAKKKVAPAAPAAPAAAAPMPAAGTAPKAAASSAFIMDDVKLLFKNLSSPESGVEFTPPSRSSPSSIQASINPPAVTWTWADAPSRVAQVVNDMDMGKYGLQVDADTLYQLVGSGPSVWQPAQVGTNSTWIWLNLAARIAQPILPADIGKIGLQRDTNTLYRLVGAAPAVWQPIANPNNTSPPFEISTGAADADSFHDFYRLQIAFEDTWSELLDETILKKGRMLYAQWDALMDPDRDDKGTTDRQTTFAPPPNPPQVSSADELQTFVDNLKVILGISDGPGTNLPRDRSAEERAHSDTCRVQHAPPRAL